MVYTFPSVADNRCYRCPITPIANGGWGGGSSVDTGLSKGAYIRRIDRTAGLLCGLLSDGTGVLSVG